MKILMADDHSLFVEGLQNLLLAAGYEVAGTASDGVEALRLARALHPDLILMDVRMPNCDGIEATRLITAELPEIKIVMLTTSVDDDDLFEALRSGASGYLLKNLKPNQLFDYLEGVRRGEAPLSRELSARLLQEFHHLANQREEHKTSGAEESPGEGPAGSQPPYLEPCPDLTARQKEILEMVAEGMCYKEIGARLHISENTVKYHMGEIIQRLHLKNREQVIAYALRSELISGRERVK